MEVGWWQCWFVDGIMIVFLHDALLFFHLHFKNFLTCLNFPYLLLYTTGSSLIGMYIQADYNTYYVLSWIHSKCQEQVGLCLVGF